MLIESIFYLNRWRIVIYGGIDGLFRILVYLMAFNNSKASIVFFCFREVVLEYGFLF